MFSAIISGIHSTISCNFTYFLFVCQTWVIKTLTFKNHGTSDPNIKRKTKKPLTVRFLQVSIPSSCNFTYFKITTHTYLPIYFNPRIRYWNRAFSYINFVNICRMFDDWNQLSSFLHVPKYCRQWILVGLLG